MSNRKDPEPCDSTLADLPAEARELSDVEAENVTGGVISLQVTRLSTRKFGAIAPEDGQPPELG